MKRKNTRTGLFTVGIAALLLVAVGIGPAVASWTWTPTNPLRFDFNNVEPAPPPFEYQAVEGQSPYITKATGESNIFFTPYETFGGPWYSTFSDPLGSLTIQNTSSDYYGRLLVRCGGGMEWGGYTNEFTTVKSGEELDWDKGVAVEVEATAVGARGAEPDGWTWAGNSNRGGVEIGFGSLNAEMTLSWLTRDPTIPGDDSVYIASDDSGKAPFKEVYYPLGGDENNAPRNVYKMTVRRSPLPVTPVNETMLVNVYVDKGAGYVRVIENVTATRGKGGGDTITIGKRDNVSFNSWGNEYHWLQIYEQDAPWANDTTPPSNPSVFTATVEGSTVVRLGWTASNDDGEVIGYRLRRGAEVFALVSGRNTTTYWDTDREPDTTYDYYVQAVDWNGNESDWVGPVTVTTTLAPSVLTFNFADGGNQTYNRWSSPNLFFTESAEDAGAYFGQKAGGTGNDGWIRYDGGSDGVNYYQYVMSDAGGGSLTVQTSCLQSSGAVSPGRSYIESSNLGAFPRFMRVPDYYGEGQDYIRGTMIEADLEFVGDYHGWCAPCPPPPNEIWPAVPPCTDESLCQGHAGSDWGGGWGDLAGIRVTLQSSRDLKEPGWPDGSGSTGAGAQYWVAFSTNDIRSGADDRITLYTTGVEQHASFRLLDPAGFNLRAEDGTANGCIDPGTGQPYPRDGVIEGDCNKMQVRIAIAPSGEWNGSQPLAYWDIWVKRPGDADFIHLNPLTAACIGGTWWSNFGEAGHTIKAAYYARDNGAKSHLALGNQSWHNLWGMKFNQVTVRNDWDGDVSMRVDTIGDLRELSPGTPVVLDATGGQKIVTMAETTYDWSPPYFAYIQQEDRSAGIRLVDGNRLHGIAEGDQVVKLTGVYQIDANGNPYIDITYTPSGDIQFGPTTTTVEPVGMSNLQVAGGEVPDGAGLSNVGLLATVWGVVSSVGADSNGNITFKLDDGSGTPVEVHDLMWDGHLVHPNNGEYWTATGPIALKDDGGTTVRLLITDNARKVN